MLLGTTEKEMYSRIQAINKYDTPVVQKELRSHYAPREVNVVVYARFLRQLDECLPQTINSSYRSMGTSITGEDSASQVAALEAMFASRQ